MPDKFEVIIVGGGAIGSSIAYFLARQDAFNGSVIVVEKDPTYSYCATTRSAGAIRQQFSTPENIEISRFGTEFLRSVGENLAVGDERPDISFDEGGYLLLATEKGLPILEQNHALQISHGVEVILLSPEEMRERFPWLEVSDLAAGSLGLSGEGWFKVHNLLMALRAKAEDLGVTYFQGEVVGIERQGAAVSGVKLGDGRELRGDAIVNAAGARAREIAAMAGIDGFPVESHKRLIFTLEGQGAVRDSPLVVDTSGVYFRPEPVDGQFICGISPPVELDPVCQDFVVDHAIFEDLVLPNLVHRVPAFSEYELGRSWAGHYAVNEHDHNAILGPHPEVGNFYLANGFSGHGLQQAPAVGRALSELIACGSYQTLDLSRFRFERFAAGELVHERNVI
ncbi:MAG: FAD-binding oxidoreductase [bacterium]|nr:FAD-binding oxidoreductase [bacterium]